MKFVFDQAPLYLCAGAILPAGETPVSNRILSFSPAHSHWLMKIQSHLFADFATVLLFFSNRFFAERVTIAMRTKAQIT